MGTKLNFPDVWLEIPVRVPRSCMQLTGNPYRFFMHPEWNFQTTCMEFFGQSTGFPGEVKKKVSCIRYEAIVMLYHVHRETLADTPTIHSEWIFHVIPIDFPCISNGLSRRFAWHFQAISIGFRGDLHRIYRPSVWIIYDNRLEILCGIQNKWHGNIRGVETRPENSSPTSGKSNWISIQTHGFQSFFHSGIHYDFPLEFFQQGKQFQSIGKSGQPNRKHYQSTKKYFELTGKHLQSNKKHWQVKLTSSPIRFPRWNPAVWPGNTSGKRRLFPSRLF